MAVPTLLKLPRELRDNIYEFIVLDEKPFHCTKTDSGLGKKGQIHFNVAYHPRVPADPRRVS